MVTDDDDYYDEDEEYDVGEEDASYDTVLSYLKEEYDLTTERAVAIIEKHKDFLTQGIRVRSMAYFVGDQIMNQEE